MVGIIWKENTHKQNLHSPTSAHPRGLFYIVSNDCLIVYIWNIMIPKCKGLIDREVRRRKFIKHFSSFSIYAFTVLFLLILTLETLGWVGIECFIFPEYKKEHIKLRFLIKILAWFWKATLEKNIKISWGIFPP